MHKFIERTLKAINFTTRQSSIAQKVPDNWKELALVGAERVRTLFLKEKVEVVLAADETFLKFHEKDDNLLVPRGVKHTSSTVIIYSELLRKLYPTKRVIGPIWDKASSHYSEKVVDYITQSNETSTPKIIVDFVDAGLTAVYEPPDVVINKPLKKAIRLQYKLLMADRLKNEPFVAGNQVSVSREELVGIVEAAYYSINMQNNTGERYIQNSFDTFGLNPWSSDMHPFHYHLSSLSENGIHCSLLPKILSKYWRKEWYFLHPTMRKLLYGIEDNINTYENKVKCFFQELLMTMTKLIAFLKH